MEKYFIFNKNETYKNIEYIVSRCHRDNWYMYRASIKRVIDWLGDDLKDTDIVVTAVI